MGEESNKISTELDHFNKKLKNLHMLNNDSKFYKTENLKKNKMKHMQLIASHS